MKLQYITLLVRDLEKSMAFYRDVVGLEVARRFNPGACEIAFLQSGVDEAMVELVQLDGGEKAAARGLVMSFKCVGRLEDAWARARGLGYAPGEICGCGPKPAYFQLPDPDGVTVEITV